MEKTALKIRTYGDPVLRKRAKEVSGLTQEHRNLLSEMAQLMYDSSGIGLAAPQVGVSESLIVVDIGQGLYKLVNPRIVRRQGSQVLEEGCLSVPGVCIKVRRAGKIKVIALDEEGKPFSIEAEGLLSCVFQHEIDHLRGRLIPDHASFLEKLKINNKLERLKQRSQDERMPGSKSQSCKLQL